MHHHTLLMQGMRRHQQSGLMLDYEVYFNKDDANGIVAWAQLQKAVAF